MDEFLDKLQEDQRRMRKFLRGNAQRFRDMGELLARARRKGARVFVVAEPPLEGMVSALVVEYLAQLPVLPVDLSKPTPLSVDPDSSDAPAVGRAAAAKQVIRHLHSGDLLLAFLHEGSDRDVRRILEAARARRHLVIAVGGLGSKSLMRRIAKHRVTLPTRGIKTVCEAVLLCSRLLARVSRAASRTRDGEEIPLLQVVCDTCNERIFLAETARGKSANCPLCKAKISVPRTSSRRLSLPTMVEAESRTKKRPSRPLKPSVLDMPVARLEDSPEDDLEALEESDALASPPDTLTSPSPPDVEVSAPVGLVSGSQEGAVVNVPSFGSGITLGSDLVEADQPPRHSDRRPTLGTTVSAPIDPYALEDDYLDELTMPGAKSDSAGRSGSGISTGSDSRRLSTRYTASDCRLRWGRGGFPDETSPRHELISLNQTQMAFFLDSDDEAGSTLQKDDELFVRLEIPAFIEPIMVKGVLLDISGTSGGGKGTRVSVEFREVEPAVKRKLVRAAENIGAPA